MKKRTIIGRTDIVDLPELKLFGIAAKIDTGANTCALHCHHIRVIEIKGQPCLVFNLLDPSHQEYNEKEFRFTEFSEKVIKNSFGDSESRFIIQTKIKLFGEEIEAEFSLTDRQNMKFPILIGRKLLRKRFIVDVARKDLSFRNKKLTHEYHRSLKKS